MEKWTSSDGSITLYNADCRDVLKTLPRQSVDSVITDPPYGLTSGSGEKGFMGKGWDHAVPGTEFWKLIADVAKPGAFLFAFGGSRTYHHLATAIESEWSLRDSIRHILPRSDSVESFVNSLSASQRLAFESILEEDPGLAFIYGSGFPKSVNISKMIDKEMGNIRPILGKNPNHRATSGVDYNGIYAGGNTGSQSITGPGSADSEEWDGWHTALKPAYEPIVVAMKPLDGTFASNAMIHGIAGLNINGCRIGTFAGWSYPNGPGGNGFHGGVGRSPDGSRQEAVSSDKGRWPANIVMSHGSECRYQEMRVLKNGEEFEVWDCSAECPVGELERIAPLTSRFYYCAKASKKDRRHYNTHPTVKSTDLMQWLVRLSKTPRGGTVLDPFMGSGTAAVAAIREGRSFIGVETESEYFEIAKRRVIEEFETGLCTFMR